MVVNENIIRGTGFTSKGFVDSLPDSMNSFDVKYFNVSGFNSTQQIYKFDDEVFNARL